MTRMRRMNADEVERLPEKYDFELISQKGSHRNILITANIPEIEWKTERAIAQSKVGRGDRFLLRRSPSAIR